MPPFKKKKDILKKARSVAGGAVANATSANAIGTPKPVTVGSDGTNTPDDPFSQKSIDGGSLGEQVGQVGDAPAILDNSKAGALKGAADAAKQTQTKTRVGIFKGMRELSGRGALTPKLRQEALERAKATGVTEEQFNTATQRAGIRESNFASAPAASSAMGANQKVAFLNEFEGPLGGGLKSLDAMQAPNYEHGSGSPLNKSAQSTGTKSGALRRLYRRLHRQGNKGGAQQVAMASEVARFKEPSIMTPAIRAQQMAGKIKASRLMREEDDLTRKINKVGRLMSEEEDDLTRRNNKVGRLMREEDGLTRKNNSFSNKRQKRRRGSA